MNGKLIRKSAKTFLIIYILVFVFRIFTFLLLKCLSVHINKNFIL